jgi:hypothetical protein
MWICILVENPQGRQHLSLEEAFKNLAEGKKIKFFSDKEKEVKVSVLALSKHSGQTLYNIHVIIFIGCFWVQLRNYFVVSFSDLFGHQLVHRTGSPHPQGGQNHWSV